MEIDPRILKLILFLENHLCSAKCNIENPFDRECIVHFFTVTDCHWFTICVEKKEDDLKLYGYFDIEGKTSGWGTISLIELLASPDDTGVEIFVEAQPKKSVRQLLEENAVEYKDTYASKIVN